MNVKGWRLSKCQQECDMPDWKCLWLTQGNRAVWHSARTTGGSKALHAGPPNCISSTLAVMSHRRSPASEANGWAGTCRPVVNCSIWCQFCNVFCPLCRVRGCSTVRCQAIPWRWLLPATPTQTARHSQPPAAAVADSRPQLAPQPTLRGLSPTSRGETRIVVTRHACQGKVPVGQRA